jgi:DNA-directed RNA polymerase
MMTDLYLEEIKLEEEARGLTIQRFHKEHLKGTLEETFSETFLGSRIIKNYLLPLSEGISSYLDGSNAGRAGPKTKASKLLANVDPGLCAFLTLKGIFDKVGIYHTNQPPTVTGTAIFIAGLIHDELRLREFDEEHTKWSQRIHADFAKRELPRYKREEYMQKVFAKADMEWAVWSRTEMVHVGMMLLHIFQSVTGDIRIDTVGSGKAKRDIIVPSFGLSDVIIRMSEHFAAMFTSYYPTVIPPKEWSVDTLETGGYHSHNVMPYGLVKSAKKGYRQELKALVEAGELDRVLRAINALQNTRWSVNTRVLDAIEHVYDHNIPCGKLPQANNLKPDPAPKSLEGLDADHPDVREYRAYCFRIHEHNRRVIGKRVMAARSFQVARKMAAYETIYFPHDLDSRGRAYPKPSGLNPQGPDYVKGLLQFATGKPVGRNGLKWLAIHGANCFGHDKLLMHERADWGKNSIDLARRVASDPRRHLEWTKADNPCQFLAWCFEWAEAHAGPYPEQHVSKVHVDLDATCSGLQHFSAMLRDKVGGFHVNMTPCEERQDVYGAVAKVAERLMRNDFDSNEGIEIKDKDGKVTGKLPFANLARAWVDFGIDRKVTKRPVMVKPYSGTRTSCGQYVVEAVDEKIDAGVPVPFPKDDMWNFKMYGADKVWKAIPEVVVAADGAMKWLMTVARLVGRSQPEKKRIEWKTPLGFPVHQYKFDTKSRQIDTFFDGRIIRPRITEDLDTLDPRQMASSVPPSFVHSMDGCHLQATVSRAADLGMTDFAAVHDSLGVHACDVEQFALTIREAFVEMYETHDVLSEFYETAEPLIAEELKEDIPPVPAKGSLDLKGILANPFFFS